MSVEQIQLEAELQAMQARARHCIHLLQAGEHKASETELSEWAVALCQWANLLRVLESDLGGGSANLH